MTWLWEPDDSGYKSETYLFLILNVHFYPIRMQTINITFKISFSFEQFVEKWVFIHTSNNIYISELWPKLYAVRRYLALRYSMNFYMIASQITTISLSGEQMYVIWKPKNNSCLFFWFIYTTIHVAVACRSVNCTLITSIWYVISSISNSQFFSKELCTIFF